MKVTVVKDLCIGCGICEATCPRVFFMDEGGKASVKVDPLTPELKDCAKDAERECPVAAISMSEPRT